MRWLLILLIAIMVVGCSQQQSDESQMDQPTAPVVKEIEISDAPASGASGFDIDTAELESDLDLVDDDNLDAELEAINW